MGEGKNKDWELLLEIEVTFNVFSLTTCNSFKNGAKMFHCKLYIENQYFLRVEPTVPINAFNVLACWLFVWDDHKYSNL